MAKKQTEVSKAVQSTVTPPVVTPPVAVLVIDPKWREYGAADAQDEMGSAMRLAMYAETLRGADFSKWEAFAREYDSGAAERGYSHPDQLRSRRVTLPLKGMGIEKPISPTSTNARPKTPEQQAKIDAAKAETDKLAKMTEAECDAEIKGGKADPERLAKLYARKVAANKAATKATDAARKAERVKLYNAIAEMLKPMMTSEDGKAQLQACHRAIAAIVAKSK
jgi:hypothetical protein